MSKVIELILRCLLEPPICRGRPGVVPRRYIFRLLLLLMVNVHWIRPLLHQSALMVIVGLHVLVVVAVVVTVVPPAIHCRNMSGRGCPGHGAPYKGRMAGKQ